MTQMIQEVLGQTLTATVTSLDGINPSAFSLIDVRSGFVTREIPGYLNPPRYQLGNSAIHAEFSADGKFLFANFNGDLQNLYVYDTKTWSIVSKIPSALFTLQAGPGSGQMSIIDQFIDKQDLLRSGQNSSFLLWDERLRKIVFRSGFLNSELFEPGTLSIATTECVFAMGALSAREKVVNPNTGKGESFQSDLPIDGVKVWYPTENKILNIAGAPPINSISFGHSDTLLSYSDLRSIVTIVYLAGSNLIPTKIMILKRFHIEAMGVSFSPDGRYLAAAGDNYVEIYKIAD